jgi:hypothetical protein
MSEPLPYSFDLFFDLKTREDLVAHYAGLKQELASLDKVMATHQIEFTADEIEVIEGDRADAREDFVQPSPKPF